VGPDLSVFTPAFDAFVRILVQVGKVLPEFLVCRIDDVSVLDGGELVGQISNGGDVELVLMRLCPGCQWRHARKSTRDGMEMRWVAVVNKEGSVAGDGPAVAEVKEKMRGFRMFRHWGRVLRRDERKENEP
jgi:hypothetical protein